MRLSVYVALVLPIAAGVGSAALAQSGAPQGPQPRTASSGAEPDRPRQRTPVDDVQARFKDCIEHWDAKTHMTKQEWRQTCQRVTDERVKYLRENGYLTEKPKKKAK